MPSEEPLPDRCGAKCRGEREGQYCTQYPVNGSERCRMHGGHSPGGDGAPEGNGRAITHGTTADPVNLYQHIEEHEREWIDRITEAYVEHLGFSEGDPRITKVRRAVINEFQAWRGDAHILEEGISEDMTVGVTDQGEPVVKKEEHHLHRFVLDRDQESRMMLKDLGSFDDPASQQADAMRGVVDLFADAQADG